MWRSLIGICLIILMLTCSVFADDVLQVLSLYGYTESIDLEREQTTLNVLLDEYYSLSKKVSGIEMTQIAAGLYEEYHHIIIALRENEAAEKEKSLDDIEKIILAKCDASVDELLTLEAEYLKQELSLKSIKDQLKELAKLEPNELDEESNIDQLKNQLKQKDNKVKAQISKVKEATESPEIGESQIKQFPLDAYSYITSKFGERTDPIDEETVRFHAGVDLHASMDTKVTCAYNGKVESAGFDNALGYFVLVDHGKGLKTIYGHLNSYIVKAGDTVKQYQQIAYSGDSGSRSTGPHLHFGVYIYGKPVDPTVIVKSN